MEEQFGQDESPEGHERISYDRESTGAIRGCSVINCDGARFSVAPGDTVMVKADPGKHPYVAFVRKYEEEAGQVQAAVRWFYRRGDVLVGGGQPRDRIVRRAELSGQPRGGDKGHFKEIYFSNHTDTVPCASFMHPVKVWCLPDDDLAPVLLPSQGRSATATTPSGAAAAFGTAETAITTGAPLGALVPGFVCRQMFDVTDASLTPLGKAARRKAAGWAAKEHQATKEYQEDLAVLLRRMGAALPEYQAEWQRCCAARAALASQRRELGAGVGAGG